MIKTIDTCRKTDTAYEIIVFICPIAQNVSMGLQRSFENIVSTIRFPPCVQPASTMIPISAFDDFETASTEVLNYLQSRLGFKLWMVTRVESENWIVLNSSDFGYNVKNGDVFRWTDSFCSRMVKGQGPRIAPKSADVPAYAAAPIGQQVAIGSYVGVPLVRLDGELFGTLCAIDPSPQPIEIADELPMIEMLARLLTTILESELQAQDDSRRAERARWDSMTDKLSGLYNRRGWDQLLAKEDLRCKRYGHPVGMISIDLDNLKDVNDQLGHTKGDEMLADAAHCLMSITRGSDVVARLGGDEFAVMMIQCDKAGTDALVNRLQDKLEQSNIEASIGMAMWRASGSLSDTWEKADEEMYESKRKRKALKNFVSDLI